MFRMSLVVFTHCFAFLILTSTGTAADVDFATQVQPIFQAKCSGCHGEEKGLGKLRLHTAEAIQKKWDDDDHLIVKGNPEESELYERLVLPADHKKFMPKKGKPLAKEELELIHAWIKQGAAFKVAAEAKPQTESKPEEHKHDEANHDHAASEPQKVPLPEVEPADEAALEKLAATGARVSPLYSGSNLLQVSFALRGEPATDDDLAALTAIAPQVYALNLAKAQISDKGLAVVSKLSNLAKLHLENSSIMDTGLTHVSGLSNLQYLNLYGTQVTDEGMKSLESLKNLRKLYLWQTKVSYDKAQAMQKAQAGLAVDLGFDHPVVMRKRLTKQIEQAEVASKESTDAFNKAKTAFDKAKQDQESTKKRLDSLKTQLDKLDGKDTPEEKKDGEKKEKPAEKKDAKKEDKVA